MIQREPFEHLVSAEIGSVEFVFLYSCKLSVQLELEAAILLRSNGRSLSTSVMTEPWQMLPGWMAPQQPMNLKLSNNTGANI